MRQVTASNLLAGVSTGRSGAWCIMSHNTKIIHQLRTRPAHADRGAGRTDADLPGPYRRRASRAHPERRQRREAVARDHRAARALGGVPDVVTPAIGRLGAILKATFEQAAPLEDALLSDLSLEHQLLDRATYVKVLADQADQVRQLAEKLITAHEATVEWLTVVLAEEALGGLAALIATPLQKVAGAAWSVRRRPGPLRRQHGEQRRRQRSARR